MKTYKETKNAVKDLAIKYGANNILNCHINSLFEDGHISSNVYKALSFFWHSPTASKYR